MVATVSGITVKFGQCVSQKVKMQKILKNIDINIMDSQRFNPNMDASHTCSCTKAT